MEIVDGYLVTTAFFIDLHNRNFRISYKRGIKEGKQDSDYSCWYGICLFVYHDAAFTELLSSCCGYHIGKGRDD